MHDRAVRPSCRGRGVAGLLLNVAFDRSRELSLRTIYLVPVQGSRAFRERRGFTGMRELEYRPSVPAGLMKRKPDR